MSAVPSLRLTPLGGVGHFGRNCLLVEHLDGERPGDALLIDCGVRFPGPELPGFDAALPDLERLAAVGERLKAIVVTHGHEDHIGALPFVLRERPLPVHCTGFTAHFIARRCARFDVDVDPAVLPFGETLAIGPFTIAFAAVSHSIPGAASLILGTPVGTVVHSGDFRVDDDPLLGPPTDLDTLRAAAGPAGIRCLLADSTGALTDDRSDPADGRPRAPERAVGPALSRCFVDDDGRRLPGLVVVGLFASHLQRLALLADTCRHHGRKLVLLGTGLTEVYRMATGHRDDSFLHGETGASHFADVVIDEAAARNLPPDRLCIAATGTQGEPQAALARLARGDGGLPFVVGAGDRVVFSARVIPGNELKVQAIVDALVDRGCDVVVGRGAPHVSGHGGLRDLQDLIAATRPASFVALHGTPAHLVAHGRLAKALGVARDRVVGLRDGHSLVLTTDAVRHVTGAPAGEPAAVDGEVCDFPRGVAATRRRMHEGGVVVLEIGMRVDDDGADVVEIRSVTARGVFPPLDDGSTRTLTSILRERHRQGLSLDDDDAERHLARPWRKRYRPPPDFVILRR